MIRAAPREVRPAATSPASHATRSRFEARYESLRHQPPNVLTGQVPGTQGPPSSAPSNGLAHRITKLEQRLKGR